MLLTLSTTRHPNGLPATDLGFLLAKHPERVASFEVTSGLAHVFYPVATEELTTAALVLEVDPVGLVRRTGSKPGRGDGPLASYVNTRPYVASSLFAVALNKVFRSAIAGRCAARPELVELSWPLTVTLGAVGGGELIRRFFEPVGWAVEVTPIPLDDTLPGWGESPNSQVTLTGMLRVSESLSHLYLLLPALEAGSAHWFIGEDEVEKLLRVGSGWLAAHPEHELITRRYLGNRRALVQSAVARLAEIDDTPAEALDNAVLDEALPDDRPVPLAQQRAGAVLAVLRAAGASRVADLGCGCGALLAPLMADRTFTEIIGADVSASALAMAERKLKLDRLPDIQRNRLRLLVSSVVYRDDRLAGLDAIILMEVIEHVDLQRLPALEAAVFGAAKPTTVIVTTPNVEYNVRYETLQPGTTRHRDHRFEWTRAEFGDWCAGVAARQGYEVRQLPVGDLDPEVGPPTQLAVFTRVESA